MSKILRSSLALALVAALAACAAPPPPQASPPPPPHKKLDAKTELENGH
jgi:hypothetical protein